MIRAILYGVPRNQLRALADACAALYHLVQTMGVRRIHGLDRISCID